MDEKFLTAFRAAATSTFRDMFGVEAVSAAPSELGANEDHGWDLTGLVGLAGQVHGVVAFRLTAHFAAALLGKTGVDMSADGDNKELVGGLVGEVTNIIAGAASSSLASYEFEIAPPVVIRGPNHRISWPAIAPVLGLRFSSAEGSFEIDLCAKL